MSAKSSDSSSTSSSRSASPEPVETPRSAQNVPNPNPLAIAHALSTPSAAAPAPAPAAPRTHTTATVADCRFAPHNFDRFLKASTFADVTITSQEGREYRAHRIIISSVSPYFAKVLEADQTVAAHTLTFADPDHLFGVLLSFIYTGSLEITSVTALPLLQLADSLELPTLKGEISRFVAYSINMENAIPLLLKAHELGSVEIENKCVPIIATNIASVPAETLQSLPATSLTKILSHDYLRMSEEYAVYQLVKKFVDDHRAALSAQEVADLFGAVRYAFLPYEQLESVQMDGDIPAEYILEALNVRLHEHESGKRKFQGSVRLRRRGRHFEYQSDFDDKGVVYFIATKGNSRPWKNPAVSGRIRVSASSVEKGDPQSIVGREPLECWTKDVPASWFAVDFGKHRRVRPTQYTLRHGGNYKADALRNWDLQGSQDGKAWVVLKQHVNDQSLATPFATRTWDVNCGSVEDGEEGYRYLRVFQKGHNSAKHNFLLLSGFEVYGDLFET